MKHTGRGLIIRSPWAEMIMNGEKNWEIRGSRTNIRGRIDIILGGSGTVLGTAELVDCIGPLTIDHMRTYKGNHKIPMHLGYELPYENTYGWVLQNVERFARPVPYKHPRGAVIWVKV